METPDSEGSAGEPFEAAIVIGDYIDEAFSEAGTEEFGWEVASFNNGDHDGNDADDGGGDNESSEDDGMSSDESESVSSDYSSVLSVLPGGVVALFMLDLEQFQQIWERRLAARVRGTSITFYPLKSDGSASLTFLKPQAEQERSQMTETEGIIQCTLSANGEKLAVLCASGMLVECFFYDSATRQSAVCMGLHPRLGKASLLSPLDPLLLRMILGFVHVEPIEDKVHEIRYADKLHALSYENRLEQLQVLLASEPTLDPSTSTLSQMDGIDGVLQLQNASIQPVFCAHNRKFAAGINGRVFTLNENYQLEQMSDGAKEIGNRVFPSWSSDGSRLAITGLSVEDEINGFSRRSPPLLWDASTLALQPPLQPFRAAGTASEDLERQTHWGCVDLVSYCPTRNLIAVSYRDKRLRLFEWKSDPPNGDVWTLMGSALVGREGGTGRRMQRMSWDPSGRFVVGVWRKRPMLLTSLVDLDSGHDGFPCGVVGFRIDHTGAPSLCGQYCLPPAATEPPDALSIAAAACSSDSDARCIAAVALHSLRYSGKSEVRLLHFPAI